MDILALIGVGLWIKGLLFVFGRTIPKGVWQKLKDPERVRQWGRDTGAMQLLWGASFLLIWAPERWPAAIYLMPLFWISLAAGMFFSMRVLRQYQKPKG